MATRKDAKKNLARKGVDQVQVDALLDSPPSVTLHTWPMRTTRKEARNSKDSPGALVLETVALLHEKIIENWDPDAADEIPEIVEAGKPRPLRDDEKEAWYNAARLYQFIELVEAAQRAGSAPCGALGVSLDFFRIVFGEVLEGRAWEEVLPLPHRGKLTTAAQRSGAAMMLERWKQEPSEQFVEGTSVEDGKLVQVDRLGHLKPELDKTLLRKTGPFDRAAAAAGFMYDRSLSWAKDAGTKQNESGAQRRSKKP